MASPLRFFRDQSIRTQLVTGVAIVHAVLMILLVVDLVNKQGDFLLEQSQQHSRNLVKVLAVSSASWVMTGDVAALEEITRALALAPGVRYAMLIAPDGKVLAHNEPGRTGLYVRDSVSRSLLSSPRELITLLADKDVLDLAAPIHVGSQFLGWSRIGVDQTPIARNLRSIRNEGLVFTLIAIVIGSMFAALLGVGLMRGLNRLVTAVDQFRSGARGFRVTVTHTSEIGRLAERFNRMLDTLEQNEAERNHALVEVERLNRDLEVRVRARTKALAQSNAELARLNVNLSDSLDKLRFAQDELNRTEKLAALGSLVAGVAHELNTPIGNAVTVASTLQEKSAEFGREVETGTLRRSLLDDYVRTMVEGSQLVMRNLGQAADLVTSFKQVAVDQTSAQRRSFDLKEVIEEVLATLHHLVRSKPIRVVTHLAPGMQMDSYPGPLGQVINNLFNNALIHGFAGREGGEIVIETRREGEEWVALEVRDDGHGIAQENLRKIFDPFFTTRLGQGGSGLGLNIVHNIVTQLLGGRIEVQSTPGQGTAFIVTIRLALHHAPGQVEYTAAALIQPGSGQRQST